MWIYHRIIGKNSQIWKSPENLRKAWSLDSPRNLFYILFTYSSLDQLKSGFSFTILVGAKHG
jgi:hypothetical protein